jgi:antitoxin YefM
VLPPPLADPAHLNDDHALAVNICQVNYDHVPVRINSKGGDAVLMSAADFDSWQETIYLLRSPANARRLMEAVARDKSFQASVVKTMEELEALAGE